jgi:uncharacterized protein YmfQ (DUF2313 family)
LIAREPRATSTDALPTVEQLVGADWKCVTGLDDMTDVGGREIPQRTQQGAGVRPLILSQ